MIFCEIWYLHVVSSLQSFLEWLLGSQALQVLVAFCSTTLALQRNLLVQIFQKVWIIKFYVMAPLKTCNHWGLENEHEMLAALIGGNADRLICVWVHLFCICPLFKNYCHLLLQAMSRTICRTCPLLLWRCMGLLLNGSKSLLFLCQFCKPFW